MDEIEDNIGIEIEAPTAFGGAALADEDTVQGYDVEEENEQLPQDDESMNDETVNNATSYATAGYSYITSNIKWFVIAMASFAVFFGIGIGLGYGPIGNSIYGNDDASSVSSAMAVEFTASDHGGKSGGGAKSGKSKSDKSSGVSCVEYVHRFCAYYMNQPPFCCKTTTNQQSPLLLCCYSHTLYRQKQGRLLDRVLMDLHLIVIHSGQR